MFFFFGLKFIFSPISQSILRDKERHSSLKSSFMKQFNEIEKWILQKKMELSFEPLPEKNKPLSAERAKTLKDKFAALQVFIFYSNS